MWRQVRPTLFRGGRLDHSARGRRSAGALGPGLSVLASALLVVACSGDGDSKPSSPSPTVPPEGTTPGVLTALPTDCGSGRLLYQGSQAWVYTDRDERVAASPGGDRTAFYDDDAAGRGLSVGDGQGRNGRRLADVQPGEQQAPPVWSPRGDRIAYESAASLPGGGIGRDIFVVNADGSRNVRVTEGNGFATTPGWSPDGTRLVYSSYQDGDYEVFSVNADGSQRRQLTDNLSRDSDASWSPDGDAIGFISDRDGNHQLYVLKSDGSQMNLSQSPGTDIAGIGVSAVSWSPDGNRIAFMSDRGGSPPKLYLVNKDGSGLIRLTKSDALGLESDPLWSPNSNCLVFTSSLPSVPIQRYVVKTDGTGLSQIKLN